MHRLCNYNKFNYVALYRITISDLYIVVLTIKKGICISTDPPKLTTEKPSGFIITL